MQIMDIASHSDKTRSHRHHCLSRLLDIRRIRLVDRKRNQSHYHDPKILESIPKCHIRRPVSGSIRQIK